MARVQAGELEALPVYDGRGREVARDVLRRPSAGERAIAPGVTARPAPGHTPGSTISGPASGGQRALLPGDVVHSAAELIESGREFASDTGPAAAAAVREQVSAELRQTGDPAAAAHFPGLAFGRFTGGERVFP